jgi:hypothetical protein
MRVRALKHLNKSFCEILRAKSHNLPRARGAAFTISFAWVLKHLNKSFCEILRAKSHNLPRARGAAFTISFAWVLIKRKSGA